MPILLQYYVLILVVFALLVFMVLLVRKWIWSLLSYRWLGWRNYDISTLYFLSKYSIKKLETTDCSQLFFWGSKMIEHLWNITLGYLLSFLAIAMIIAIVIRCIKMIYKIWINGYKEHIGFVIWYTSCFC